MGKKTLSDKEILKQFSTKLKPEHYASETLVALLEDWIQARRENNKRMTTPAVTRAANKMNQHSLGACISALEETVDKSYIGIFPEKHEGKHYRKQHTQEPPKEDSCGFCATSHLKRLFDSDSILGFGGHDHPEDVFHDEIYIPARGLGFLDKPKELTEALFGLMTELSKVRSGVLGTPTGYTPLSQTDVGNSLSPRDVIDRYIKWLANQNWLKNMNLGVFDFQGSVFNSFVRQESRSNNNGRNILTGGYL